MNICPPAVKRLKQEDFTNAKPRHPHTLPHYSHVILLVLCLQLRLSDSFSDDTLSRNIHAEQTSCGEPERKTSSQRSLLMSMSVENKSYHDVILKDIVSSSVTDVWWSSLVLQAAEVEAQVSAFAPWSNKKL